MRNLWSTVILGAALAAGAQHPPGESANAPQSRRDLKVDPIAPAVPPLVTAPPAIPRSYALVIGVAKYPNLSSQNQLYFPERDAEAIYSILISPEGGNFRAENVRKLVGSRATLANVRTALEEWLPSVAKANDRVLIYFAGHGFVHDGRGYLAPYDIRPDEIAKTGYPMDTLGTVVGGKILAKDKILLTDACHSGAIRAEDTQNLNRTLLDLGRSLFSLTASRDREQSFESPEWGGGHGIFTYYVVRALEGEADESGDGIVTADELHDYVYRNVREATEGRQNPNAGPGFDPSMLMAYVPSRARPAAPPAPKFGALVVEANMEGVEIFLDGKAVGIVDRKPLRLPGLTPGTHTIKGVKMGYEPDGPREEMVYPGQESTVRIRILIPRRRSSAASDALEKGVERYMKGGAAAYRQSLEDFRKALSLDPAYSQAALYLARAHHALYEHEEAQRYFRKAIEIDPDYLEARVSFGGMLLDTGNVDEAIRQLNFVLQREPANPPALTNLAQAYRLKDLYAQSVETAQRAIKAAPNYAEPHLWLADSLRLTEQHQRAKVEYERYLALSNFDTKLAGQLNYYVLGFLIGMGKKTRAAQRDIWAELRSLAYFGICNCEYRLSRFDAAIENCRAALTYDRSDPYAHHVLGLGFMKKAIESGEVEGLEAASQHFRTVIKINPHIPEAEMARQNIKNIEEYKRTAVTQACR